MGQGQRRDPRITSRQRLWCEGQEEPGAAETRDVSHSGMFIVAEHAPEVGARFNVNFDNEEGEVSLKLEVMWRGPKSADNQ
ncbi:MAG TPA: PilZ domain-containing protein, partial [Polyangiales bacterium]